MKKYVLFTVAALFSIAVSTAQEVRLGVKGGVDFATLSGDDLGSIKSLTGFHIGALAEIPITEQFAVQPEVLYSAQGAEYRTNLAGLDVEVKEKLDYIQIPVMAKYYVIDGLSIEAGPHVGFLASSKIDYEGTLGGVIVSGDDDLENVSKIDFGLGAGASYRLPMGLFFTARYNFGLSNINDASDASDNKIHNRVAQLSVGYSF